MAGNIAVDLIEKQNWLEPIADRLQPTVASALDHGGAIGPEAAKLLHGTWSGNPLHVVLTDVPIGSWTAAAVLDLLEENTGSRSFGHGADAAITVGLLGASAAAVTGIADWSKIGGGRPRRIGLAHGLLNVSATVCYLTSLCFRLGGARRAGRQLACLGYVVSSIAAHLGGHLVYKEKLGVDHAADFSPPDDFVAVLSEAELRDDQLPGGREWNAAAACAQGRAHLRNCGTMRPPRRTAFGGKAGRPCGQVPVARLVFLIEGRAGARGSVGARAACARGPRARWPDRSVRLLCLGDAVRKAKRSLTLGPPIPN